MYLLENDIRKVKEELTKRLPVFLYAHGEVRARVLINMAFNMGIYGLMGFRRMLSAFYDGEFEKASREMIDSAWARQVGKRAIELAEMMRTGKEAT
jgi:lysozyme